MIFMKTNLGKIFSKISQYLSKIFQDLGKILIRQYLGKIFMNLMELPVVVRYCIVLSGSNSDIFQLHGINS